MDEFESDKDDDRSETFRTRISCSSLFVDELES